jgi:hypothetical protein
VSADAQRARLERDRLELLTEVYNVSQGDLDRPIDLHQIGDKLGISHEQVAIIFRFFEVEHLVRSSGIYIMGYSGPAPSTYISITAKGIKEIEQALKRPDKPTKHFSPPSVILKITGGTFSNSPFQIALRNSIQNLTIAPINLDDIKRLLMELKEIQDNPNLQKETKEELEANTRILHIQSRSDTPKRERIKGALSSIQSILEESSEIVSTAAPLATRIGSLLTGMG